MDDLTLDFLDAQGKPTDSTIWLRNGGGKSSILNLFFAIMRTGRREFLGGKADSKQRRLEDYILPNDRGVVVAEWELDVASDTLEFAREPGSFLTGVFYERRAATEPMRRLFFASRVANEHPESTLMGLPLFDEQDGQNVRRTMASFKQAWSELFDRAPHLQPTATEVQSEWHTRLQDGGLDPDLFSYQLRMNLREGGADELFRFSSDAAFVDFLLELTVDPKRGDDVSTNIVTYRKQLQRRRNDLLPDREMCLGLLERLSPLAELAEKRAVVTAKSQFASDRLKRVEDAVGRRMQLLDAESEAFMATARQKEEAADKLSEEATLAAARVLALERFAQTADLEVLSGKLEESEERERVARLDHMLWKAAVPCRTAMVNEAEAAAYRQRLTEQQTEHEPLLLQLNSAAKELSSALKYQALIKREKQSEIRTLVNEMRSKAQACEENLRREERGAITAKNDLESLEARMQAVDEQLNKLVDAGILAEEEEGAEALERLEAKHKTLVEALAKAQSGTKDAGPERAQLNAARAAAQKDVIGLEVQLATLQKSVDRATAEREELERDPALLRLMEVEELELQDVPADVAAMAQRRALDQQERIATLKAQLAGKERERLYLEEHSLLPPQPGVEALLALLTGKIAARSGWELLRESGADWNERIQQAPELAQSVVVTEVEFERAVELAAKAAFASETPTLLTTEAALWSREAVDKRVVYGPRSRAYFDKEAGRAELESLESRRDRMESDIEVAQTLQDDFSALSHRLRHFFERFPAGWFVERRAELLRARSELDDKRREFEQLNAQATELDSRRGALEESARGAQNEAVKAERELNRVRLFVDEYESKVGLWKTTFAERYSALSLHRSAVTQLTEELVGLRKRIDLMSTELEPLAEEARLLEVRASSVPYLDGEAEPQPGQLDALELKHERLQMQYERNVGDDELRLIAEHHEAVARQAWKDVERLTDSEVSREAIRKALDELGESESVEDRRERAEERLQEVRAGLFEMQYELKSAKKRLNDAIQRWREAGEPDLGETIPRSAGAARGAAAEARERAQFTREEAEKQRHQAAEASRDGTERKHAAASLRKDADRLASIRRSYGEHLLAALGEAEPLPQELNVVEELDRLEETLEESRVASNKLDEQRKSCVASIRQWTTDARFEHLRNEVATRFRVLEPEPLEREAKTFRAALDLRIREIARTLEDIERHRVLLTKLALNAAEEGLRQLKLADRSSRVPGNVPEIGGAQFLKIATKEPTSPRARLELIGELIDSLIDKDDFPTGIELVQKVVRKVASPFRIKVLNPDPATPQRYIPITETARFSGGEQLTCAILLYCTLANVRARSHGRVRQPSSVLLLDNPIGRASRVRFLEMQREFARAMGIQLIYTTAVNDHEALSILPNVIRLRNERVDRRRGHRLVEGEEKIVGLLESVRVARRTEAAEPIEPVEL